jgi:hypothetical protein
MKRQNLLLAGTAIAGYLTHLQYIDFCHRSASAITIPLGLALE